MFGAGDTNHRQELQHGSEADLLASGDVAGPLTSDVLQHARGPGQVSHPAHRGQPPDSLGPVDDQRIFSRGTRGRGSSGVTLTWATRPSSALTG